MASWNDWFLTAYQSVWGYFIRRGKEIAYIVHLYLQFLEFLVSLLMRLYNIKYSYPIQMICK